MFSKFEGKNLWKNKNNYSLNNLLKEGRQIAINTDYLAMALRKLGQIGLVNFYDPEIKYKSIQKNEKYNITDIEFSPFQKNMLSLSYNNKPFISIIEFEPSKNIIRSDDLFHKSNVSLKNFNPQKSNLICSCDDDGIGYIWDINNKGAILVFETEKSPPKGIIWSPKGDYIGICSHNRKLNIFDKNGKNIFENVISDKDIFINNFEWIDDGNIVTIGWEKNEQKIKLWDLRNNTNHFEELIITKKDDKNDISPFVNQEMKLIYTVRKEEYISSNPSMIVYYLNENKKLEKIYEHFTECPGFCTVLLKNKSSENKNNEINRFARYSLKENKIYYVCFTNKKNLNKIENNQNIQKENVQQFEKDLENQKNIINEIQNKNDNDIDISINNNDKIEQDNKDSQNIINKLKEELKLEKNLNKNLNKKNEELKLGKIEKEKLCINAKEKLEELDKVIYKKDLLIKNRISELNNLKEQVNLLLYNKAEQEKELNKYKRLLEEKEKEINQVRISNARLVSNFNIVINSNNLIPNSSLEVINYYYYCSNKDFSFICSNSEKLKGFIKLGTDEFSFEFLLKNDGKKQWYNFTILKNDISSDFNIPDIILEPLKPNEEKNYKITVKNIEHYQSGKYNAVFVFESGGMVVGNKLIYELIIYDYNMINKFRQTYKLNEKDYSDEEIYSILKKNYFNFENAYKFRDIK